MTLIENLPEEIGAAARLLFTANSTQLVVALRSGAIQILELQNDAVVVSQVLDTTSG